MSKSFSTYYFGCLSVCIRQDILFKLHGHQVHQLQILTTTRSSCSTNKVLKSAKKRNKIAINIGIISLLIAIDFGINFKYYQQPQQVLGEKF